MKRIDAIVDRSVGGPTDGANGATSRRAVAHEAALAGQAAAPEAGVPTPVKTRSFNEAAHKLEDWPTHQQEEDRTPNPPSLPFARDENRDVVASAGKLVLALGAIGVVYGDIGTSPLYTEQVIFTTNKAAAHTTIRRCLRGRLADLLGADDRGDDQVRRHHHASPQPRRRRDHGAYRAGPAAALDACRVCSSCSGSSEPRFSLATA